MKRKFIGEVGKGESDPIGPAGGKGEG